MRWLSGFVAAIATVGAFIPGTAAAVYKDAETGFTFTEYSPAWQINKYFTIRIAVPSNASNNFDTVLQIIAAKDIGWAGVCWGGKMLDNPLAVAWASGSAGIVSSRYTKTRSPPQPYTGSTYEILRIGTKSNTTHWQVTAKCSGCTSWGTTNLNAAGSNRLAWAASPSKPATPTSNSSSFSIHESYNYWSADFASAANADFAALVAKNR